VLCSLGLTSLGRGAWAGSKPAERHRARFEFRRPGSPCRRHQQHKLFWCRCHQSNGLHLTAELCCAQHFARCFPRRVDAGFVDGRGSYFRDESTLWDCCLHFRCRGFRRGFARGDSGLGHELEPRDLAWLRGLLRRQWRPTENEPTGVVELILRCRAGRHTPRQRLQQRSKRWSGGHQKRSPIAEVAGLDIGACRARALFEEVRFQVNVVVLKVRGRRRRRR